MYLAIDHAARDLPALSRDLPALSSSFGHPGAGTADK
jgi:hypothetical protein